MSIQHQVPGFEPTTSPHITTRTGLPFQHLINICHQGNSNNFQFETHLNANLSQPNVVSQSLSRYELPTVNQIGRYLRVQAKVTQI